MPRTSQSRNSLLSEFTSHSKPEEVHASSFVAPYRPIGDPLLSDPPVQWINASHAQRKAKKEKLHSTLKKVKAEIRIATGVATLYKEQMKSQRLSGGEDVKAKGVVGTMMGMAEEVEEVLMEQENATRTAIRSNFKARQDREDKSLLGSGGLEELLLSGVTSGAALEEMVDKFEGYRRRRRAKAFSASRPDRRDSMSTSASCTAHDDVEGVVSDSNADRDPGLQSDVERLKPSRSTIRRVEKLAVAAGAAAVAAGVATQVVRMKKTDRDLLASKESTPPSVPSAGPRSTLLDTSTPLNSSTLLDTSTPIIRVATTPRTLQSRGRKYLSELSAAEHFVVRHAAAALLLREPEIVKIVGDVNGMLSCLVSPPTGEPRGPSAALFGVSLKKLVKYESTESHHGFGPGTLRIPTFVDHCISALKLMDLTIEGLLRRSGNVRVVNEIINALNHGGDDGFTVDLAGVDPVTLMTVFKAFLRNLPDPVLTGKLFSLFICASHIKNVVLRRRMMHLVVCMMPKVNRDVMEVIFLFLDWLASFAHITVKVGNQMDLSNIATVMAPTLLHPNGRDPKPAEIPYMVQAVLTLLEDQHILHEIPYELAEMLHVSPKAHDSRSLLQKFREMF